MHIAVAQWAEIRRTTLLCAPCFLVPIARCRFFRRLPHYRGWPDAPCRLRHSRRQSFRCANGLASRTRDLAFFWHALGRRSRFDYQTSAPVGRGGFGRTLLHWRWLPSLVASAMASFGCLPGRLTY